MKLSKTEKLILDSLESAPKNISTVSVWGGRKPYTGGYTRGGKREFNATLSLIEKGFVERIESYKENYVGGGFVTSVNTMVIKLK